MQVLPVRQTLCSFYRTVILRQQSSNQNVSDRVAAGPNWSQEIMILTILMKSRITRCFASIASFFRLKLKVQTEDIAEYGLKPLTEIPS